MCKKHWVSLMLAFVVLAVLFAGCAAAPEKEVDSGVPTETTAKATVEEPGERKPLQIAFLTKTLSNPYFVTQKNSLEKEVSSRYPEDTIITFDCDQDTNRELSIVEDCIVQGFDVIILTPIDHEGTSTAVKKVVDAGILCVLLETTANMDIADLSVMSDNFQAGYLAMEGLAKAMGQAGKIVTFGNTTNPVGRARDQGCKEALKEYPNIEVVNVHDGVDVGSGVESVYDIMNHFLNADPDIGGVWCYSDPNAEGVAAALKNANLIDKVYNVGIDAADEACDLIRAGELLGTSAQFPLYISEILIANMYEILENGPIDQKHIQVPCHFIDDSNVDTNWVEWPKTQPLKYVEPQ